MGRAFNFIKNIVNRIFNNEHEVDHDLCDHLDPEHPFELDLGGSG